MFGVSFVGTSGFRMPESLLLRDQRLKLSVPEEVGAGLDFINLALDDEYGLRHLQFRPRTILDVGANFGLFSLLAAHYHRGALIHAYEPNPRVYPLAERNLSLVSASAFQIGIGSCSGLADVHELGESRLAQTIASVSGSVRIISLSEAIGRIGDSLDLLKLDCEGAEWDIFEDVEAFRKIRLVRMEYHLTDGRQLLDLKEYARKLGFRIDRLNPNQGFGIAWLSNRRFDA